MKSVACCKPRNFEVFRGRIDDAVAIHLRPLKFCTRCGQLWSWRKTDRGIEDYVPATVMATDLQPTVEAASDTTDPTTGD